MHRGYEPTQDNTNTLALTFANCCALLCSLSVWRFFFFSLLLFLLLLRLLPSSNLPIIPAQNYALSHRKTLAIVVATTHGCLSTTLDRANAVAKELERMAMMMMTRVTRQSFSPHRACFCVSLPRYPPSSHHITQADWQCRH